MTLLPYTVTHTRSFSVTGNSQPVHFESAVAHDERHRCLPGLRAGVREALLATDAPALRLSYGALQGAGTALACVEI